MIKNVYCDDSAYDITTLSSDIVHEMICTLDSKMEEVKAWNMVNRSFVDERGHFSFKSGLQLSFEDCFLNLNFKKI